jgi:uncharacterized membrane protein YqiK
MRMLPSRFNPAGGLADFWNEIRRPQPYRWPILIVSILPAAFMVWWGVNSTQYGEPERPQIEYITTLDPARSEAEIAAEIRANQEIKDLREAEEARIAEEKRRIYKEIGRASGMDVEEIERKAAAERAAEKAEAEKRRAEAEAAAKAKAAASQGAGQ